MEFHPKKYQLEAYKKIMTNDSVGLFLDMGLGKTVITLTAVSDLIAMDAVQKVLVIAPLQTAQNTWPTEVEKWDHTKHLRVSLILGSADKRRAALESDADIYVVNRENVQWLCEQDWIFDMVILDELSSFKSASSKRFKALRKKMPLVKRVVGLTGTPAPNGYIDLWPEVYLLDRGQRLGRTVGVYRQMYFHPARMNGHVVYDWALNRGAKEAINNKLSDLCISMKAVDMLDMPGRIETEVYVQMERSEKKLYERFGREHVLPDKDVVGVNAASVQGKLLQMANGFVYDTGKNAHFIHNHKIEALKELREAAAGKNLLVYYNFIEDKQRILEAFSDAWELCDTEDVKRWNQGEIPMLLAHPASAGHGLNLQAGGNIIVWYGLPWSLELYQQANARLYRQGQTETVYIYHIITKDTHDEDILPTLKSKDATQEDLLRHLKARIEKWKQG